MKTLTENDLERLPRSGDGFELFGQDHSIELDHHIINKIYKMGMIRSNVEHIHMKKLIDINHKVYVWEIYNNMREVSLTA